jgi:uncharacterized protein YoxC
LSEPVLLVAVFRIAAVALMMVVALTIWKLLKTVERLSHQMDRTLKEFEGMAEEVRRATEVVHKVMSHVETSAANVEHLTEGVRGFRRTLDAATAVLQFAVVPVLGNVAGGLAGARAAASHIASRFFRKEEKHGK